LDGDGEVHGGRAAVELRWRILPLLHGFESGLMKHGRAGEHFHGGDVALGIDQGVEGDVSGNVLRARHRRIDRGNGFDEAGLLDVSANGSGGGGLFTVAASQAGKRIGVGSDLRADIEFGVGRIGCGAGRMVHDGSSQAHIAESRFFGLSDSGSWDCGNWTFFEISC
jgi:hypothetical protein